MKCLFVVINNLIEWGLSFDDIAIDEHTESAEKDLTVWFNMHVLM